MSNQQGCGGPLEDSPMSEAEAVSHAARFKAMGDPVRLRLLSLIASHAGGEACVCDLNDAFDLSGPTISHHLKVLKTAGLVDSERRGTWVYYRAVPDSLRELNLLLGAAKPAGVGLTQSSGVT